MTPKNTPPPKPDSDQDRFDSCPVARAFEVVGSKWRFAVLRSRHLSGKQGCNERKETTTGSSVTVPGFSGRPRTQKPINSRPEDSPIAIDDTLTERGKRAGPRHRVRT